MGNVLRREKWEQVIALGRLGWSLRRIEEATGVLREMAGEYLRRAGVAIRPVGSWGEKSLAKAASQVTTGAGEEAAKPAIAVTTDPSELKTGQRIKTAHSGDHRGARRLRTTSRPLVMTCVVQWLSWNARSKRRLKNIPKFGTLNQLPFPDPATIQ